MIYHTMLFMIILLSFRLVNSEEKVMEKNVDVQIINYRGWDESVEISNGTVKVVVVPKIGRIMHYGFLNEENVLWENPDFFGKVLPADDTLSIESEPLWANFGGDKVWSNQQDEWPDINGRPWPPDHWFDGSCHSYRILDNGVEIISPVSGFNGARSIRQIRLESYGNRLHIHQIIEKVKTIPNQQINPLHYTIWNITQIRFPEETLFPLNPHSHLPDRFHVFPFRPEAAKQIMIERDIAVFFPDNQHPQKVGADSDGWIAGIVGNLVIGEIFKRKNADYPEGNLGATIYTCPEYAELELLSPLVQLDAGEKTEYTIAWELFRIPPNFKTPKEKRKAAVEWLEDLTL